eukprot:3336512-Pleurochrysis_carterae.AAC.1
MAVTRAASTNTHRNNRSGFVRVQAVATPALHHHSHVCRQFLQQHPPPEHQLARAHRVGPPPFRQGRQGQSGGASIGQRAQQ